jgi:uncharacterized protein
MPDVAIDSVLWRRLDFPGHDACQLQRAASGYELKGMAVFLHGHRPCSLQYRIRCNTHWLTDTAHVVGVVGRKTVEIRIERIGDNWIFNRKLQRGLVDCKDIDLSFTPATNTLPVRRLRLSVGETCATSAAWLRFPSLTLARLDQTYTYRGHGTYAYCSLAGKFKGRLRFRPSGLITSYPTLWTTERADSWAAED